MVFPRFFRRENSSGRHPRSRQRRIGCWSGRSRFALGFECRDELPQGIKGIGHRRFLVGRLLQETGDRPFVQQRSIDERVGSGLVGSDADKILGITAGGDHLAEPVGEVAVLVIDQVVH